ncbi:MAG TPA: alternative ribosome rescue aminoacyl-tRNA hydrolase ArfB [Gemmatimonadales bacterium]|nr:alternative ribosome rescue aminoacyl-tRNA hydrolase ArfB [Gemmatimonadales bacterium]
MDDAYLEVAGLRIPRSELLYRASRSGGPGGQHVNTSSTRIEVVWDIAASPSIDDSSRARLLRALATRLDREGRLRLVSGATRSQLQNRETVTARLAAVVEKALHVPTPRRRTKPSRAAKAARLEAKRKRSGLKESRRPVRGDD